MLEEKDQDNPVTVPRQNSQFQSPGNVMANLFNWLPLLSGRQADGIKAKVEVYTWQTCPFCIRAKLLLWWKGVKFIEYKIDGDDQARQAMAARAEGRRTVPQIFVNDQGIGGCDQLYGLDSRGQLDLLLATPPNPA